MHDKVGQGRTGQGRTGQGGAGKDAQDRAGQDSSRTGKDIRVGAVLVRRGRACRSKKK